ELEVQVAVSGEEAGALRVGTDVAQGEAQRQVELQRARHVRHHQGDRADRLDRGPRLLHPVSVARRTGRTAEPDPWRDRRAEPQGRTAGPALPSAPEVAGVEVQVLAHLAPALGDHRALDEAPGTADPL